MHVSVCQYVCQITDRFQTFRYLYIDEPLLFLPFYQCNTYNDCRKLHLELLY